MTGSHVTTHVLDTGTGLPAVGVRTTLSRQDGDGWEVLAVGVTDADGRVRSLGPEVLASGAYRIDFDTGSYFDAAGIESFFPEVVVTFLVLDSVGHYHVPLLLSPFSYSTYRGS